MLNLRDISYTYKETHKIILDNFNFNISKGESISFIGPSGCGKTTLLNIIAGYLKPNNGFVTINNEKVQGPGRDRIIINQENDLFFWMKVKSQLKLISNDEYSINKILNIVHLQGAENLWPYQLSGGMKKRLALARALVAHPVILLLDEPFGSLDTLLKEQLQKELTEIITRLKTTIILVTHDIDEAIFLSNRIMVLGGSPLRIIKEIKCSMPFPRQLQFKETIDFMTLKRRIKKYLIEN